MAKKEKGMKAFIYDVDGTNLGEVGTLKGSTMFELLENVPFHKLVVYSPGGREEYTKTDVTNTLAQCRGISKEEKEIDVGKEFMKAININDWSKKDFASEVTLGHRYFQQEAFDAFMKCIEQWARMDGPGIYDDRNIYAVKASAYIMKCMEEFQVLNRW